MTADLPLLPHASAEADGAERVEAEQLFDQHCDYVWNTLRRLGIARAELEDLTHDTFVAVFRQWRSYDASRPLRPWLFGFALRVASDHRRRARHRFEVVGDEVEVADHAPGAVELLVQKERAALAQRVMHSLELGRRAVFILHELDGVTLPEIATALEIPLGTATSRLRLARQDFAAGVKRLQSRSR